MIFFFVPLSRTTHFESESRDHQPIEIKLFVLKFVGFVHNY